ncbi:PaaI family thioesterase [Roseiarcus sp.]|uniref:PaaI family thioesterase n=1 Tax=Roseiarcus sp. TaxID=1969460 RepID=UPI003F9DD5CE
MTPLDRIRANPLPFAGVLGLEFVAADEDRVSARMVVRPDLCTLGGVAHGGAIMSFADTLGGALAFITLPEGAAGTTTLESKTNFVGAARAGTSLLGACAVVHRGRRTQVIQTRVETEEGKLVALVIQTQMTL